MTTLALNIFRGGKFDDFFSPILVKELRQGMRGLVFVSSFLLTQVFLVMFVLADLAAQADRNALEAQSYYFWVVVDFVLLILMPLRGLGTITAETRNRTMETILLTRMSAWRIVFGKWSALFAQSLLFVSAVLPYVVLRYFIGGEDIVVDFEWLFFSLWLSGLLIATSIAISALGNVIFRVALIIGLISLVTTWSNFFVYTRSATGLGWEVLGWLALAGFFVPAVLFELTASLLAPASENHALPRRLYALGFFLLASGMAWLTRSYFTPVLVVPLIILVAVCYFDLAEKPRLIPRMVRAFTRWPMGRLASLFLLPGWPSALLFSLVVIPATTAIFWVQIRPAGTPANWFVPLMVYAIFGSILVPIFICHLFWKKLRQVLVFAFFYNAGLFALTSFLLAESNLTHTHIAPVTAFLPGFPSLIVTMAEFGPPDKLPPKTELWYFAGNSIVLGALLLTLLIKSRPYFRQVFATGPLSPGPENPAPQKAPGQP